MAAACKLGTKEALPLLQRVKAPRVMQGMALLRQARLYLDRQEPNEAIRAAGQAGALFRSEPYGTKSVREAEIECVELQMDGLVLQGLLEEAKRMGLEQGRRFRGLKEPKGEGQVLMKLAHLHEMRMEGPKAMKAWLSRPRP